MIGRMTDPYRNSRSPEWAPSLTGFLSARLTEDERVALNAALDLGDDGRKDAWSEASSGVLDTGDDLWPIGDSAISRHAAHFDPARMLSDCAAKRQIVLTCDVAMGIASLKPDDSPEAGVALGLLAACAGLALPYADHPDYREEWRP